MITNSPPTIRRQPTSWSTTSATIDYSGGNYRLVSIGSNATATVRRDFATNANEQHTLEYNLALLNGGSATVKVQQLVGSSYVDIAGASQTHTASGSYTLTFTPTQANIRVVVSGTSRFALTQIFLDRTHLEEVTETYMVKAGGYRYGFNGMEKDDEVKGAGNSLNYTYRMHDTRLGRFFATDPIAAQYPFYSPYAFSGNRVIDAVELEGLQPGVLFDSQDAAAINFGQYYNDNSIREGVEYGSLIYKITDADTKKVMYAYSEANVGSSHSVSTNVSIPEGATAVAITHTHGEYLLESDNEFSMPGGAYPLPNDISNARKQNLDSYVTTPSGATRKFDVNKNTIQQISNKAPSDPKDPKNNGIPSNYENFIKLGNIEFNSDKARKSKKNENVLIVTDISTGDDYGVVRNKNGSYDFFNGNNNTTD